MEKHEILTQIDNDINLVEFFYEKYKSEFNYSSIKRLIELLHDIKDKIDNDTIPLPLFDRFANLIKSLEIDKLRQKLQQNNNIDDISKYHDLAVNILINGVFVYKIYTLFKVCDFTSSNIVLIGANGSGKTMFANSIQEELELSKQGIVIPAQKILIFPTFKYIPEYNSSFSSFQKQQSYIFNEKKTYDIEKNDDFPYSLAKESYFEMQILLSILIGEKNKNANVFFNKTYNKENPNIENYKCTIDIVIEIWNNLIEHRILHIDSSNKLKIKCKDKDKEYDISGMSSGEREIFYLVGRILLANKSSMIIVDEPEMHLHKSILNKLWDILEKKRDDCMFIYLTHDLNFASTRIAKKYWLKTYSTDILDKWNILPLMDSEIPEELLMQLLGSRKKILFCEGQLNKSLDKSIYELLLPDYTIIPVISCKDVINYTKAFNKINNTYSKAYGIIDKDYRTDEQIQELSTQNIYTLDVAEIENLFLMQDFINDFLNKNPAFGKMDFNILENKIFNLLKSQKEIQISKYIISKMNYYFTDCQVQNAASKKIVIDNYNKFLSKINIDEWYNVREKEIDEIINKKEYLKALKVFNNKGLLKVINDILNIYDYKSKALNHLKNSGQNVKNILLSVLPKELRDN